MQVPIGGFTQKWDSSEGKKLLFYPLALSLPPLPFHFSASSPQIFCCLGTLSPRRRLLLLFFFQIICLSAVISRADKLPLSNHPDGTRASAHTQQFESSRPSLGGQCCTCLKYVALAAATGFHLIVENDFGGRERRGHDVCLGGAVGEQVDVRPVRMIRDVQQ